MSSTERVYALYVQANPIPDPQRLLATSDEAELLLIEGSRDMDTKERIDDQAPRPRPSRKVAVIAFATLVLMAGAIAGTTVLIGGGSGETTGTVVAVTEPQVAPIGDLHEVTFDGEACTLSGPTVVLAGERSFVLRDVSDEQPAGLQIIVRELVDGHTFQELVDNQNEYGRGPGTYFGRPGWVYDVPLVGVTPAADLGPHRDFREVSLDPGTHAVAVWTPQGGEPIWLCAPLDVVEP